jgi:hypothetical protein
MVLFQLPDQSPQSQSTACAGEETANAAAIAKQQPPSFKPVPGLFSILISPLDGSDLTD